MKVLLASTIRKLKKKQRLRSLKTAFENRSMAELLQDVRKKGLTPKKKIEKVLTNFSTPYRVNLCSGDKYLPGFINVDLSDNSDICVDLERELLPFPDRSVSTLVCISAINYFDRERAFEIIQDVYRVLAPGGVVRFATQDLRVLSQKYLDGDKSYYFTRLPMGRIRFPGETIADKFMHFYYGFGVPFKMKHSKYIFDYETLALLFEKAGFRSIEQRGYQESQIPEVKSIDNRPEQLFFLEAKKDDISSWMKEADALEKVGKLERAWQIWAHCIQVDPSDTRAFERLSKVLIQERRPEDLRRLCAEVLKTVPNHSLAAKALAQALMPAAPNKREFSIPAKTATALSEQESLELCLQWLSKAQDSGSDGGVCAMYDAPSRSWHKSYPETTGYIIPTFLAYHQITKNSQYLERAKKMADWEVEIQTPMGGLGEPVGQYMPRPRIFNDGQVLLGWVAIYKATKDARYLDASRKLARAICSCLDADGAFRRNYVGPRSYCVRVAWALLELNQVDANPYFFESALRHIDWVMRQSAENGFFWESSFDHNDKPITHLSAYTHVGLLECYRILKDQYDYSWILAPLVQAADHLCDWYDQNAKKKKFIGFPGRFLPNWKSKEKWSCMTGNAQYAYFLKKLAGIASNSRYSETADQLLAEVKSGQILGDDMDPNLTGGIWGSSPPAAEYCPFQVNNWGVKFFADSLIAKLYEKDDFSCLG